MVETDYLVYYTGAYLGPRIPAAHLMTCLLPLLDHHNT
jgi:hypothetical protein